MKHQAENFVRNEERTRGIWLQDEELHVRVDWIVVSLKKSSLTLEFSNNKPSIARTQKSRLIHPITAASQL